MSERVLFDFFIFVFLSNLFVLQNKVKDEAPKGGEVDVELSIGGRVGDQQDDNEDDGVGVRDDEPVGNVLGEHLDRLRGLWRGDNRQSWFCCVRVGVQGHWSWGRLRN